MNHFSIANKSGILCLGMMLVLTACAPREEQDLSGHIIECRSETEQPGYEAVYAVDGDPETVWFSGASRKPQIECVFVEPVEVNQIEIQWGAERPESYTLYRQDGLVWKQLIQLEGLTGNIDRLSFPSPISCEVLRLQGDRVPEEGISLAEIRLAGFAGAALINGIRSRSLPEQTPREVTPEEPMPTEEPAEPVAPPIVVEEEEKDLLNMTTKKPPIPEFPKEITDQNISEYLLAVALNDPDTSEGMSDSEFLELVAQRTFGYFWWETNPTNGLTRDRARNFGIRGTTRHSSIAAVGFALPAYVIGAERGWISKEAARQRIRNTLRTFDEGLVKGYHGFYSHFVDMYTGENCKGSEISTIDTALLLCGAIVAMEYFKNDTEIATRTRRLFERADWQWACNGHNADFVSHGLKADGKTFINVHWCSFSEGIMIYPLALGSTRHALPASAWYAIDRHKGTCEGYEFIAEHGFQSIFRYLYPALYFDFRNGTDKTGIDYYDNVRRALLGMRAYCISKEDDFPDSYGADAWGLGAADGPGNRYYIYGFPPGNPYSPVDGSIIPYAVAGALPFLPRHALSALRNLYDNHHEGWGKYGFADCINPSLNFVSQDVLGLDQGPILLAIENARSGLIWKLFMRNRWIKRAQQRMNWESQPHPEDLNGPVDLVRYPWRFHAGDGHFSGAHIDDSNWLTTYLPDHWENHNDAMANHDGIGWYRTTFNVSALRKARWLASGRPVKLTIGGVDDADEVFINGTRIGETLPGPNVFKRKRSYTVPAGLLRGGRNVVAIRVTDNGGSGGIWLPPISLGPGNP